MADDEEIGTPGKGENGAEDVYDDEELDELTEEDDAIEPWEEGFMKGASGDGQQGKCAHCGKPLMRGKTFEKEYEEDTKWFCSEPCVEAYDKHHAE